MDEETKEYFKSKLIEIMTLCGQLVSEIDESAKTDEKMQTRDCEIRVDDLLDDSAFDLLERAQARRRGEV